MQIDHHYNENARPKMSIEKLQKIVTTLEEPKYKTQWLRWWNSSQDTRLSYQFPFFTEKRSMWMDWIVRALLWAKVCCQMAIVIYLVDQSCIHGSIHLFHPLLLFCAVGRCCHEDGRKHMQRSGRCRDANCDIL